MVYKPNFCCNCGEKIKRGEWKILTSRRFCDVCAVEQKGHELLMRAIVAGSLLVGIFGFGSYLRIPQPPRIVLTGDPVDGRAPASVSALKAQPSVKGVDQESLRVPGPGQSEADPAPPTAERTEASKEQLRSNGFASDNAVFYCGAMTKKRKPCSRRVKSKGRCWQHAGQPPTLAPPSAADLY